MTITMEQVRAALDPEEPDYAEAAKLGADALVHLKTLIHGTDVGLAAKAASLAGMISAEPSVDVLVDAAVHEDARVRVAAAAAARHLSSARVSSVLLPLLSDADIGVQKTALQAASVVGSSDIRAAIADLAASHRDPVLVDLAVTALRVIDTGGGAAGAGVFPGEMPSGVMDEGDATSGEMPEGRMDRHGSDAGVKQEMPSGQM